ncbi:MAG: sulfatase [Kiritimatiellales bacterium]|nr:sulfatase [Kiritimatiellales bacterium]MCF7863970.1 sulfatase [Kiritimatiellales bacterium]
MKWKSIGVAGYLLVVVAVQGAPMNVVFILADDLGWADTTLYGKTSLYETPNLERLAKRGMVFTHAYSASPLCSPTRASILTGQTPARTGITAPNCHLPKVELKASVNAKAPAGNKSLQCESATRLDTALPTLGKLVKAKGYATAHFGKWHLGPEPYSPLEHGFDIDIPHWPGPGPAGSYVAPWKFKDFKENHLKEHIEDRMAEEAVKWMQKTGKGGKPFFMNYWMFSVHAPFDAKQELIDEYRKKINPSDPQRSPTYAAMIHSMDDAVGSLLDAIDAAGIAGNTAIIFTSDNGGNMYNEIDDTTPTSNFPLRGGKATMFEGGIRVPCVVVWPGITKPGSQCDDIIQSTDFYPTILDLLKIPMPKDHVVDGIDMTPALRGGKVERKEGIITFFPHAPAVPDWLPPAVAIHVGDWKLIRLFYQGENRNHGYLLYNLAEDLGEQHDLSGQYPERVATMDRMIEDYLHQANAVVPQPNPAFDPAQYHPEKIGVQAGKHKASDKTAESNAVDGWIASGTCSIKPGDGVLAIDSTGEDPFVVVQKLKSLAGGPFTLRLKMKSSAAGEAMVYYGKPAVLARTVGFPAESDGIWHEYRVELPTQTLNGLRIDPARGVGHIEIDWIRLEDASKTTLKVWEF